MLLTTRGLAVVELAGPDSEPPAEHPCGQLLAALDEGWQITEPVYRGLCDDTGYTTADYYFILRRGASVVLRIVPECETVRQFLRDRQLRTVDAFRVAPGAD